jgi:hypothetical protein
MGIRQLGTCRFSKQLRPPRKAAQTFSKSKLAQKLKLHLDSAEVLQRRVQFSAGGAGGVPYIIPRP